MKIAIVTLANHAIRDIAALTMPNMVEYAKRHNYDLIVHNEVLNFARPPAWSKIVAMQRALPNYDAACWLDSDIAIMDMEIRLEDFMDDECDLIAGGSFCAPFNSGAFILRNTPAAFRFLSESWDLPLHDAEFAHHITPKASNWEQGCMQKVLHVRQQRIKSKLVGYELCSPYWQSGKRFLLHPNGSQNARKIEYLDEALHPEKSFCEEQLDTKVLSLLGNVKLTFTEFCEGNGSSGVARKLARAGWSGDLIGEDVAQSDAILKEYWGFNSIRTHGCPQAGQFHMVIIHRAVPVEHLQYAWSNYVEIAVGPKPLSIGGFSEVFSTERYVVLKRNDSTGCQQ